MLPFQNYQCLCGATSACQLGLQESIILLSSCMANCADVLPAWLLLTMCAGNWKNSSMAPPAVMA